MGEQGVGRRRGLVTDLVFATGAVVASVGIAWVLMGEPVNSGPASPTPKARKASPTCSATPSPGARETNFPRLGGVVAPPRTPPPSPPPRQKPR